MENLTLQEEIKETKTKVDFNPIVKKWLMDHGYKRTFDSFNQVAYTKGYLSIAPDISIATNGFSYYVHSHQYVDSNGKCLNTNNHYAFDIAFEEEFMKLEKGYAQACKDLGEFYNQWFGK